MGWKALAWLEQPGIPAPFAVFEERGTVYAEVETPPGGSVLRTAPVGPAGSEATAIALLRRVAEAVAAIHEAGLLVLHLDPAEIRVDRERVILYGLDGMVNPLAPAIDPDEPRILSGYSAPEVGVVRPVGVPTDVYALAALLYHLLAGTAPLPAVLRESGRQLPSPRELNPAVSEQVADAILKALSLDPEARPGSVSAFLGALGVGRKRESTRPAAAVAPENELRFTGHSGPVLAVAAAPEGRLAVSAGEDASLCFWEITSGRERHRLAGHEGPVTSLAFSGSELRLASAARDGTVRLWQDNLEAACLRGHEDWVNCVDWHPHEWQGLVASGGHDRAVRLWNALDQREERAWSGFGGAVNAVAFNPSGALLAAAAEDGKIYVWARDRDDPPRPLALLEGPALAVVWLDDLHVAAAGWDGVVRLWAVATGMEQRAMPGHVGTVSGLAICGAGDLLASGGDDRTVRVWDLTSGAERARMEGHLGPVAALAFGPQGEFLLSGSWDRTARGWRAHHWSIHSRDGTGPR